MPQNWPLDESLDIEDALFVDVIHTDVAPRKQIGHADFFPNGGGAGLQPGCESSTDGTNIMFIANFEQFTVT